jgi:hypothetical protein
VRINAKGIIERIKVWEAAAKLLAAANINEAEVELLPKAPLEKKLPAQVCHSRAYFYHTSKAIRRLSTLRQRDRRNLERNVRHSS